MASTDNIPTPEYLKEIFERVDKDKSGVISAQELQQALANGTWTPFNIETIRLMIALFDSNQSGTINIEEFEALWKFIIKWEQCFCAFDRDQSGSIDVTELNAALKHFGFFLTDEVINAMIKKYNNTDNEKIIYFDNFIQCCVKLTNLTRAFRAYDKDANGWVYVHYNQYLGMLFQ